MSETNSYFQNWLVKLLSVRFLPGKYILSKIFTKLFFHHDNYQIQVGAYTVAFNLRDDIQREMYFGIYEPVVSNFLINSLRHGDVFFDVGSNIGYFSVLASSIIGEFGQVHSFEPIEENHKELEFTINQNKIKNITANNVAVGPKNGEMTLYTGSKKIANSGWASLVKTDRRPDPVIVNMLSLDEYININNIKRIDMIKMDIEGAEFDALLGAEKLLSLHNGVQIICEINPFLLNRRNMNSTSITHLLADYGYKIYILSKKGLELIRPENEITTFENILCKKDWSLN